MADALESIFEAINKSEMIAQVEKEKHKKVKDGIDQLRICLKKQDSQKAGHMSKKANLELALADSNIGIKVFKAQEESLSRELSAMEKKLKVEKQKNDDIIKNIEDSTKGFIENVENFSKEYGLCSIGAKSRTHSAKEYLKSLEAVKMRLEIDGQEILDFNSQLKRILDENAKKRDELTIIAHRIDDLQRTSDTEMDYTKNLENKISMLISEPDNGSEFVKVREDLQKYEVTELELGIKELERKVQSLTKKLRNREAKALRQQYKHWQRQQHKKSQKGCKEERSFELEDSSYTPCMKEPNAETSTSMNNGDMTLMCNKTIKTEPPNDPLNNRKC